MRTALLTDIHGNREALEACLAHAERNGAERLIFLGDYVGYGADPAWVVDAVMAQVERGAIALAGNHDMAIGHGSAGMNQYAAAAIEWTRPQLNATHNAFLDRLPLTHEWANRLFVHASAHNPEKWEYVNDLHSASKSFIATRAQVTFCGHTHRPRLFHMSTTGKFASFDPVASVEIPLLTNRRWLAVIGAVGQPRDGNPAACYAMLDDETNALLYHRVPYDNQAAAQKVLAAGLPKILADRLIRGD